LMLTVERQRCGRIIDWLENDVGFRRGYYATRPVEALMNATLRGFTAIDRGCWGLSVAVRLKPTRSGASGSILGRGEPRLNRPERGAL
jgi:hypothetical protein